MPITTYDGDFTIAQQQGPPLSAVKTDNDVQILQYTYTYMQAQSSYARLPVGTVHPTDPTLFLFEEGNMHSVGGEIVTFERIYQAGDSTGSGVPASRSDYESFLGRCRFAALLDGIPVKIYSFIPDSSTTTYASPVGLTSFQGTIVSSVSQQVSQLTTVSLLSQGPSSTTSRIQRDYFLGNPYDIPILTVSASAVIGTSSVTVLADFLEICVEESIIRRWRGDIYERSTRYARAQHLDGILATSFTYGTTVTYGTPISSFGSG